MATNFQSPRVYDTVLANVDFQNRTLTNVVDDLKSYGLVQPNTIERAIVLILEQYIERGGDEQQASMWMGQFLPMEKAYAEYIQEVSVSRYLTGDLRLAYLQNPSRDLLSISAFLRNLLVRLSQTDVTNVLDYYRQELVGGSIDDVIVSLLETLLRQDSSESGKDVVTLLLAMFLQAGYNAAKFVEALESEVSSS